MDKEKGTITSKQLLVFICSAQIGIGILFLPSEIANEMGHSGWIAIVLLGIISTIAITIISLLLNRYKSKSILEINKLLYGRILGSIFNYMILIYVFISTSFQIRILVEVIRVNVLRLTPPVVLTFAGLLATFYLSWYGLKTICRFNKVVFLVIFIIVILTLNMLQRMNYNFLRPVVINSFESLTKGMLMTNFAYLGYELIPFIYDSVKDKDKVLKCSIIANLISGTFFIFIFISTVAFLGENFVAKTVFPMFMMARGYRNVIFERVDLFFSVIWLPAMASSVRAYYFIAYDGIRRELKIKKKTIYFVTIAVLSILLSRLPKDIMQTRKFMEVVNATSIGIISFYIFSYFFSFINKKGIAGK